MFCLCDANSFYASCERCFNPKLADKPVIVLSNNDGCVIARTNEAKALGIKMGVPYYQIKDFAKASGVAVFSSNYELYGEISARIANIVSSFSDECEPYSIDELFVRLPDLNGANYAAYARKIRNTVTRGTGIPVSLGVAPTKTLAKVANKFAKKVPAYKGVCVIDTDARREKALKLTPIDDVWGIGRRYAKMLRARGVNTAYDFTQQPEGWVKQKMTVAGQRIWQELNGIPLIDMELIAPDKRQICTSRAFGEAVTELGEVEAAVASYAGICAQKLRKQNSYASALLVFIETNAFRDDLPQCFRSRAVTLPVQTSDTLEITKHALEALRRIFPSGIEAGKYRFKKAGVIITEIGSAPQVQADMFDKVDRKKQERLMAALDKVNAGGGFNGKKVTLGVENGRSAKSMLKRGMLSRCYTTRISDIIKVKA